MRAARPRADGPPGGSGQTAGPRRISGLRPQQPGTLARRRFRPSFSVSLYRLTGSAAARRHRDHRARRSAHNHPPTWATGRDLRRDHPIPATPGTPATWQPAGTTRTPPVRPASTRATWTSTFGPTAPPRTACADHRKCQRTRPTAPQKAKQRPAPTAAPPPKGTSGRLATGPATGFTAAADPAFNRKLLGGFSHLMGIAWNASAKYQLEAHQKALAKIFCGDFAPLVLNRQPRCPESEIIGS